MPPSSSQPRSGLSSVQRNWSSSSVGSSIDPAIDWPPTPPTSTPPSDARKALTGAEKRLKAIQDALSGTSAPSGRLLTPSTNSQQSSQTRPMEGVANGSKRPLPADSSTVTGGPPLKKRQLPNSWDQPAAGSSHAGASRASSSSSGAVKVVRGTTAASKPAAVFLSQEQSHILRLVEGGQSLFYTGSAGAL
jgi:hypothetical protein